MNNNQFVKSRKKKKRVIYVEGVAPDSKEEESFNRQQA
jgi:hypothetical protein